MPDLSRTQGRSSRQTRPTTNRSAILPNRPNTDTARRQVNATLGAARRGDGGAAQLREIFGGVEDAAQSFAGYTGLRHEERVNEDNAQGLIDAATGEVDEAKLERSEVYRKAVLQQRTQREWLEASEGLDDKVKELLQGQDNPDPAVRESQVLALLEDHFKGFAIDEDGQLKDFGSPEANRWLAENMARTRAAVASQANQEIENLLNQESVDNATLILRRGLVSGADLDFETSFEGLLPTVDRKVAKQAFIDTVIGAAADLNESDPVRAEKILRQLEGSLRNPLKVPEPLVAGNLPLTIQDRVTNPDGSVSTVRTISFETADGEVLIPTVINGNVVSSTEAIAHYEETGENFGTFKSAKEATAYAKWLHEEHEKTLESSPVKSIRSFQVSPVSPIPQFEVSKGGDFGGARNHNGIDLRAAVGTPVKAPLDGEVVASWSGGDGGQQIRVRLSDGSIHGFAHLSARNFRKGDKVSRGEVIGLTGNSGKSTGPHLHYTIEVGGKKIDPRTYSGVGDGTVSDLPEGDPVDPSVANPQTPSETADAQLGELALPSKGTFSLSTAERNRVAEVRRTLRRQADVKFDRELTERQAENSFEFLDRLHGLGQYPTITEVQQARRNGDLSSQQTARLLGIIQSDQDRAISRSERTERRAEADLNESRGETASRLANGITARVISGKLSISDAHSEVLETVAGIDDPEIRSAVLAEVQRGVTDVRQSRERSAEAVAAVRQLEDKRREALKALVTAGLRRKRLKQAQDEVNAQIDQAIVDIGKIGVDNGNVEGVAQSRIRNFNDFFFDRYF